MKSDRLGDWLWEEWDGDGYEPENGDSAIVYCTYDWVDVSNDLVKRALASCLQRDGIADSLSDGFILAERAKVTKTYAGTLKDEKTFSLCDNDGETFLGDMLENVTMITFIEF